MPAYLISLFLIVLVVMIMTHFTLQVSLSSLFMQILRWIMLGIPFPIYPTINNYFDTGIIDAGVYWTLRFEILFYLTLPFLIWFAKGLRLIFLIVFFGVIYYYSLHIIPKSNSIQSVLIDYSKYMTLGFLFGMIAAFLKNKLPYLPAFLTGYIGTFIIVLFLLLQIFMIQDVHLDNYTYKQSFILFIPFLFIVYENSIFGLLKTRAALFLGMISYSIYLFHGILLFVSLNLINIFYPINTISPYLYWLIIGVIGVLTIVLSAFNYRFIEHVWITKSLYKSDHTRLK